MPRARLTKAQIEAYLKNPNQCPYCASDDITYTEGSFGDSAGTGVSCNTCEKSWGEAYTLSAIVDASGHKHPVNEK